MRVAPNATLQFPDTPSLSQPVSTPTPQHSGQTQPNIAPHGLRGSACTATLRGLGGLDYVQPARDKLRNNDGDYTGRTTRHQQQFIKAMAKKATRRRQSISNPIKVTDVLGQVGKASDGRTTIPNRECEVHLATGSPRIRASTPSR
ncbi:hypothetical protein GCM10020218_049920 [Dactylosporangium vinaceum]